MGESFTALSSVSFGDGLCHYEQKDFQQWVVSGAAPPNRCVCLLAEVSSPAYLMAAITLSLD